MICCSCGKEIDINYGREYWNGIYCKKCADEMLSTPEDTKKYEKIIAGLQAENAALRERLEKAVDKTIVSEMLAKYFDCPCNFSPLDEEMWAYCRDNCVDDNIECWIRVINKKCAELKGEKELQEEGKE